MSGIKIDDELSLIPYYDNFEETFTWYQDPDVCKQVDNIDFVYSMERLKAMYRYLNTHGDCFYIAYQGELVGDITLCDNEEICIVIRKESQNRHIGRRCIRALMEYARKKGMQQLRAQIYSFNGQSRKMFLSCGFQPDHDDWYVLSL